jgi:hypothetical protein
MPKLSSARRGKKTFSLSRQSLMFLEALRKERRSRSNVLKLGRSYPPAATGKKEMEGISASFTQYYDSLTAEDIAEDRACGDFAATQFPSED